MEVRETQQMRYQIGYDYYWNCFESFRFQGKVVEGACINVLFSPILTCRKEDYEKRSYFPEQKYKGEYLYRYIVPEFKKDEKKFEFVPTQLIKNLKEPLAWEIVDYFLFSCPNNSFCLEPYEVTEKEFCELFSRHDFVDLQTSSYFGKEKGEE